MGPPALESLLNRTLSSRFGGGYSIQYPCWTCQTRVCPSFPPLPPPLYRPSINITPALWHTALSHTHTQLCHTILSHTYTHTQLGHTQHCHTHTHHFVIHDLLTQTQLRHTQLCHTGVALLALGWLRGAWLGPNWRRHVRSSCHISSTAAWKRSNWIPWWSNRVNVLATHYPFTQRCRTHSLLAHTTLFHTCHTQICNTTQPHCNAANNYDLNMFQGVARPPTNILIWRQWPLSN